MIKGKVCYFTRKDIKGIDSTFDLYNVDELKLHDLLEEYMLDQNFVLFDNDIEFDKEIIVNGWHERRYNCFVLKGKKVKGRFILHSCGIQYKHIA